VQASAVDDRGMTSEKRILNEGLVGVSALPDVLAWRNNSGQAWQGLRVVVPIGGRVIMQPGMVVLKDSRPISFGLPGSGDILGVAPGFGFALEAKTDSGRQSDQQKKFQQAFERAGGRYGLFRSPEEAVRLMEGWRNGTVG
jgi:hypothetical protein